MRRGYTVDLLDYKLKGYCCSQIVADVCLKKMGKENQDLVDACAGLCIGLSIEANCALVSSAVMMMTLKDPKEASEWAVRDFIDWFEEAYGTIECRDIIQGNQLLVFEKCPAMIEATISKIDELMEWD